MGERAGLPDGRWILIPKIPFWVNFGRLSMEDVGIFYCHLGYFVVIWNILRPFGIFHGYIFVYFMVIWYIFPVLVC
jgi:hypothetical protein